MRMNPLVVTPYQSAGPYRFGMNEVAVLALGQQPLRKTKNPRKESEWDFESYSIRFGADDGLLCDIGFSKQCAVAIDDIDIFSQPDALEKILQKDANVYEFYGFLIFFDLGITLTGFHDRNESDKAMTAFRRGHWDSFKSKPKLRKWK